MFHGSVRIGNVMLPYFPNPTTYGHGTCTVGYSKYSGYVEVLWLSHKLQNYEPWMSTLFCYFVSVIHFSRMNHTACNIGYIEVHRDMCKLCKATLSGFHISAWVTLCLDEQIQMIGSATIFPERCNLLMVIAKIGFYKDLLKYGNISIRFSTANPLNHQFIT